MSDPDFMSGSLTASSSGADAVDVHLDGAVARLGARLVVRDGELAVGGVEHVTGQDVRSRAQR